jgi:inosose dehydratase
MIRVANAPCSWGVLEFERVTSAPFGRVLDEIHATGYDGTELGDWGFMPTDPVRLRDEVERRGLEVMAAFVPIRFVDKATHASGAEIAMRTARLLRDAGPDEVFIVLSDDNCSVEQRAANAGRIDASLGLNGEQWSTFAEGVESVARLVREEIGVRSVFHPHCGGYVETVAEIDQLMSRTDPAVVGLCPDTGHITYAGGDPVHVLDRYADRVWHVHFKDCHPAIADRARRQGLDYLSAVGEGVFCELGAGSVDFAAVIDALRRQRYAGWVVVEQDVLPNRGAPADSARRNRDYLRGLGLR